MNLLRGVFCDRLRIASLHGASLLLFILCHRAMRQFVFVPVERSTVGSGTGKRQGGGCECVVLIAVASRALPMVDEQPCGLG